MLIHAHIQEMTIKYAGFWALCWCCWCCCKYIPDKITTNALHRTMHTVYFANQFLGLLGKLNSNSQQPFLWNRTLKKNNVNEQHLNGRKMEQQLVHMPSEVIQLLLISIHFVQIFIVLRVCWTFCHLIERNDRSIRFLLHNFTWNYSFEFIFFLTRIEIEITEEKKT